MSRKKPLVVLTRKLPDVVETRMRELFDARLNVDDKPMSQDDLVAAMRSADVLVPTVTDRIDAELIEKAGSQLKLIANFGNGVDNIDVGAALQRGIAVTNTPGVLTQDTADMTMALILAVARRIVEGAEVIPEGNWTGWSPTWMLGAPNHRQEARHRRHGPHRPGARLSGAGLRPANPLSQPPPRRVLDRRRA